MRFISIGFAFLFALCSSATTTVYLTSPDYNLTVLMEGGSNGPYSGTVKKMSGTVMGECNGSYEYNQEEELLSFVFDDCEGENLEARMNIGNIIALMTGQTVTINYRSEFFDMEEMTGIIHIDRR